MYGVHQHGEDGGSHGLLLDAEELVVYQYFVLRYCRGCAGFRVSRIFDRTPHFDNVQGS